MLTTPTPLPDALKQLADQYNLPLPIVDWQTETTAEVEFRAQGWVEASVWPAIIRCYQTLLGVVPDYMPARHESKPDTFVFEVRVMR
jgi:hypothetical protein